MLACALTMTMIDLSILGAWSSERRNTPLVEPISQHIIYSFTCMHYSCAPWVPLLRPQAGRSSGPVAACSHVAFASWILFNVLFNHAMCTSTQPGCTTAVDPHVSSDVVHVEE